MTSEAIISTMVDRIVGRFGPSRVVLFGSQARGTAREGSDVDLLVVMGNGGGQAPHRGGDTKVAGRPTRQQGHSGRHAR